MGFKQRLLETPAERVPADVSATVTSFCEPIESVRAAYVGLTEITEDFGYPREQLAVAFELAGRGDALDTDLELRRVADRFYDSMPEDLVAGGCNILEPAALAVWRAKAQRVFARSPEPVP